MKLRLTIPLLGLAASFFLGCNLPQDQGIKLGVPFRSQVNFNYCSAASVLMWRLYDDRNAEISQESIFSWMSNYYPACGSNQLGIEAAVRHFTLSGGDAFWDNSEDTDYKAMLSRQVASIDSRIPVIAVVDYDHTGVVNGGKFHVEGSYNVWDFVYFHDPGGVANRQISATDWMDQFCPGYWGGCDQIISSSASSVWFYNLQTYGNKVVAAGGGTDPRGDWPPAY